MIRQSNSYNEVINGEVKIIHEELDSFSQTPYTTNINILAFIENITPHLSSIEQKISKSSIDHIKISTEIVDVISNRMMDYINKSFSECIIDNLSTQETVNFYVNQRKILMDAFVICRKLESWNMDYAYRIKKFNVIKKEIEDLCREKQIDTRSSIQKGVDQLKTIGVFSGIVAKETAGCAIGLVIKVVIVLVIFLIIRAIVGVK